MTPPRFAGTAAPNEIAPIFPVNSAEYSLSLSLCPAYRVRYRIRAGNEIALVHTDKRSVPLELISNYYQRSIWP